MQPYSNSSDSFIGRGGFEQRPRIASDRSGSTEKDAWRGNAEEDDGGGWRTGQRSWRRGSAGTLEIKCFFLIYQRKNVLFLGWFHGPVFSMMVYFFL